MPFSPSDYQNILIANLVLSLLLFSVVLALFVYFAFVKIQGVRKELKAGKLEGCGGRVFPLGEDKVDLEKVPLPPPIQQISPSSHPEEATFVPLKSSTPSSLLSKSFTSTDFTSKTLLDKKCFALAGNQKGFSGGLKELIS